MTTTFYGIEWTINNGSEFEWNSVEIGYYAFDKPDDPMSGFNISARPYKQVGETREYIQNSVKLSISNGHPDNYGVELFVKSRSCGIVDGSEYSYMLVFDQTDFEYLPINSGNTIDTLTGPVKVTDKWPLEPEYLDVKDPNGKAAPIFPMDIITRFAPDPRLSVTITYNISAEILPLSNETPPVANNKDIVVTQEVTQAETDYAKQLEQLASHTMYGNGVEFDYSPDYPYTYPHTTVSTTEPTTLTRSGELERGDVWYNPETNVRKYYSIGDVPENLTIVNKGRNYRKTEEVECVWQPKDMCLDRLDRDIPRGLYVDLELINGTVENVSISPESLPKGWEDGDEVVIMGGDNQARLRIGIENPAGWVDAYITKMS